MLIHPLWYDYIPPILHFVGLNLPHTVWSGCHWLVWISTLLGRFTHLLWKCNLQFSVMCWPPYVLPETHCGASELLLWPLSHSDCSCSQFGLGLFSGCWLHLSRFFTDDWWINRRWMSGVSLIAQLVGLMVTDMNNRDNWDWSAGHELPCAMICKMLSPFPQRIVCTWKDRNKEINIFLFNDVKCFDMFQWKWEQLHSEEMLGGSR